jgi:hypothetical protein
VGIEVQIDRGAVDDLGDLIVLVIVVKEIAIQRQRAVQQRILRANLERIDEFRFEGQRMRWLNTRIDPACGSKVRRENRARRIGATGFVAMCIGTID